MNPPIHRGCLAVLLSLVTASNARAETAIAPSVEWLSCAAKVIVRGKVTKIATVRSAANIYDEPPAELRKQVTA